MSDEELPEGLRDYVNRHHGGDPMAGFAEFEAQMKREDAYPWAKGLREAEEAVLQALSDQDTAETFLVYVGLVRQISRSMPDARLRAREVGVLRSLERWVAQLDEGRESCAESELLLLKGLARDLDEARRFLNQPPYSQQHLDALDDEG